MSFYKPTVNHYLRSLYVCFLSAISLCGVTAAAQESNSAYDFLNVTSSAKAYGLGGANISTIGAGIDMIEQNPALLGPELGMAASANYTRWLGSSNFAGAKFAHPINDRMAYAVGLQYYGYGDFEGYNEWGISTGTFSAQDVNFFGSLSHDFTDRLRGGVTVKVIYSGYEEYTAWAMAADLGINYYDDEHDLSLSAVVTNLGGQIKRFTDSYGRAARMVAAVRHVPHPLVGDRMEPHKMETAILRHKEQRGDTQRIGAEGQVHVQPVQASDILCRPLLL